MTSAARHLYVHLPFCAHRCGYCDFVTSVGRREEHATYADALLLELEARRDELAHPVGTVFLGGGTPTFTEERELLRILEELPRAAEITIEANPETITPRLAMLLRRAGVTRVSIGAQSFQPRLLTVLERQAGPDDVRRAVHTFRDVGFDNISLDLLYGIPGQSTADLERDLAEALALETEHLSCYELEAKPGTRFTHAHGRDLARQAEDMEAYFELVVETLTRAGYRWYETSNFCATGASASSRDLRAQHNLGIWHGDDYVGLGVGAVSTLAGVRRRNGPSVARYAAALAAGEAAPHADEVLDEETRRRERVMLGLRLDTPLDLDGLADVIDAGALERLVEHELVDVTPDRDADPDSPLSSRAILLTRRGRFLGGGVTAELLAS